MTSSSDIMVASQKKTTNHKIVNKHVTIGDSTIVVMTPDTTPETPDIDSEQAFHHALSATTSSITPPSNTIDSNSTNGAGGHDLGMARVTVTRSSPAKSWTSHDRPPSEEYYDVRRPEAQDQTLESRDNPFLPGGELSREAEDLLSRATIIRDHFYLNEEEKRTLREQQQLEQQQQQQKQQRGTKHVQIVDHHDGRSNASGRAPSSPPPQEAIEERISPQSAANASAAPVSGTSPNGGDSHQPRENGKVGDGAAASPDSVKLAIPDGEGQSLPQSQTGPGGGASQTSPPGGGDLQVHDSDKKRRNKCCSIM